MLLTVSQTRQWQAITFSQTHATIIASWIEQKFRPGKMQYCWLKFALVTVIYFMLIATQQTLTTDPLCSKCIEDKHAVEH